MFANKIVLQKKAQHAGVNDSSRFFSSQNLSQQVVKMAKKGFFGHILTINWHHFLKKRPFGADIYLILTWQTSLTVKEGKNNSIWNKFAASSPKTVSCDDQNSGFRPKSGSVQQLSICFHDRYRLENGT